MMFVTLRAKRALLKGKATRVTRADMNFDLVSFPKMERGVSAPRNSQDRKEVGFAAVGRAF